MMKNWISFVLLLTLTTSPAWADEAENFAMAHVRLSTEPTMATGCLRVGQVMDDSVKDLRRKIVKTGGDTGILSFGSRPDLCQAFRCAALPGHLIRAQRRVFHLHRQEFHHHLLPSSRGRPRTMSAPSSRRVDGSATLGQIWTMEAGMKKRRIVVAMVLVLLSGCAGHFGIIRARRVRVSDRSGPLRKDRGTWHANLGICEVCP